MKDYLEILNFRHACKIFDESKKISDDDFNYILEAGRLSPSSMGLEQWDLLVVQNEALRQKIREKSWNQPQMTTCSHLVVILAKVADLKTDAPYIEAMIARRPDKNEDEKQKRIAFYKNFLKQSFKDDDKLIFEWANSQCMFLALNMMNAAAFKGIDSCAIAGFEREAVEEILGIDTKKHRLSLMVPLGYRLNEQPPKYRRNLGDIVKFIN